MTLAPAARLMSPRMLAGSLAAVVLTAMVFVTWPGLDLAFAGLFVSRNGGFVGRTPAGEVLRLVCTWAPIILSAAMLLLYAARRWGGKRWWSPTGAGVVMLGLSLALGPGLLVNGVLKAHSHRPRPYQVVEFGGDETFRPFYRFDGACRRNCSFVSGEGAVAFWTLAPALLVPLAWRTAAVAGAIVFGLFTSLLRIAFGGHFLSDSIFAGLFTWLVILACWWVVAKLWHRQPDQRRL